PILSVLITIYILFHVFRNVKESLHILLQGSPADIDSDKVSQLLLSIENVEGIHDLHIWSIDGNYNILTVHVVLKQPVTIEKTAEIKNKIRKELLQEGIEHATIEFETTEENCSLEQCC
ncbi:MAG TPA: cation diffusion facilitator family transporter, partial [Paludibacteraceae bacterium]|nr:cation diffusion facilitator family transporter [Paludibacteraceae bacterium]